MTNKSIHEPNKHQIREVKSRPLMSLIDVIVSFEEVEAATESFEIL